MKEHKAKKDYDSSSKHKHKKKKHHKKKRDRRSSSRSSESEEMEWVEAPAPKVTNVLADTIETKSESKRDDWMNEEVFVATLNKDEMRVGSSREKKKEAQAIQREKEKAIQNERELNPHWKNDGSGLPENQSSSENLSLPSTSVGDGGYSYLKKAYYRIMEQSQQEGKSMEEIAVERWGSLNHLLSLINEAEARMKANSKSKYSSDQHERTNRHEKRSSLHHSRPSSEKRSPNHSPQRTFKFQKPKHKSRNERKTGHFSSTDRKRYRDTESNYADERKYKSSHSERSPESIASGNTSRKSESDYPNKRNIPAWKKVKPGENRDKSPENVFAWEKGVSLESEKIDANERNKNTLPSWKKTIEIEETENTHDLEDNSPEILSSSSKCTDYTHKKENTSEQDEILYITSSDDVNKLAAKYTKATLLGNTDLASKLKKQLDEAREILNTGGGSLKTSQRERERVLLTKMDSCGVERPIQYSRDISDAQSKQTKKQSQKFFDDGSRYSLKQMFEREKLTTADDNLEMFMEVAGQCQDANDENETSGISKKATNKMAHHLQEEKDVGRAIHQHQKRNAALGKCNYCLDQPNMKRHLIVKKYKEVYLCIPDFQSLVEGHCLIVPNRHVPSFLALDEEEWREVEDLKCSLRKMFRQQEKNIIILETSRSFKYFPHAFLEIIPVPEEISDMAPLYFKKAILESETEWANNIKLIDLSKKGLRHSVPKNLPYFCVQFDPNVHAGYAHVIEDEKHFERNFGKEVVGGMLDIDYNYLFKNRKEDPTKKSKETLQFMKMWEKFHNDST